MNEHEVEPVKKLRIGRRQACGGSEGFERPRKLRWSKQRVQHILVRIAEGTGARWKKSVCRDCTARQDEKRGLGREKQNECNGILEHIRERLGEMIERKEGGRSETTKLEICQRRMLGRLYQTNEYKSQNNMVGTVMCISAPGASTKLVRSKSM